MITVENLSKRYAAKTAIEGVSFQVEKGEILGFLGPNGAGKTTTMRIVTGFMPASDGTVKVDGFDVFENPLDVRRRIGYLPENPPLYLEMTVTGYLRFVAKIKGVPKDKVDAVVNNLAVKRLGTYADCGNVCDFFISPASDNITGQVIYLGGIT